MLKHRLFRALLFTSFSISGALLLFFALLFAFPRHTISFINDPLGYFKTADQGNKVSPASWRYPEISFGDPKAPVTLVKYSAFGCPHCARFALNEMPAIKKDFIDTGRVRFVVRPVTIYAADRSPEAFATGLFLCLPQKARFAFYHNLYNTRDLWLKKTWHAVRQPIQQQLRLLEEALPQAREHFQKITNGVLPRKKVETCFQNASKIGEALMPLRHKVYGFKVTERQGKKRFHLIPHDKVQALGLGFPVKGATWTMVPLSATPTFVVRVKGKDTVVKKWDNGQLHAFLSHTTQAL